MTPIRTKSVASDDEVLFLIAIHLPLDRTDEQENAAYEMAEDAAHDLTYEMRENIGPGFKVTLDV
jgi:hypothetical protein